MADWVQCTQADGTRVYVNFDNVTRIMRTAEGTVIGSVGNDAVVVTEQPEDIIPRSQITRRD